MRKRSRGQLVLALDQKRVPALIAPRSAELVQALADLLLEALNETDINASKAEGGRDESKDHA